MIKVCKWCKKKFSTTKLNQDYCGKECAHNGKLKYQREYEAKKKAAKGKTNKKPKKKSDGITDIAVAARAAGMTYGEYVARVLKPDSYRVHRRDTGNENK